MPGLPSNVQHCHAWQEDGGPSLGPVDAKGAELMQTRARAMSGAAVAATREVGEYYAHMVSILQVLQTALSNVVWVGQ